MDNKNYEDKINKIKNYLKQKEKEVEDNKVNKYNDYLKFDDDTSLKKDSVDKDNNIKINSTDNINKKNDIKKEVIKNKKNILNIILIILLFLEPLFITLSFDFFFNINLFPSLIFISPFSVTNLYAIISLGDIGFGFPSILHFNTSL